MRLYAAQHAMVVPRVYIDAGCNGLTASGRKLRSNCSRTWLPGAPISRCSSSTMSRGGGATRLPMKPAFTSSFVVALASAWSSAPNNSTTTVRRCRSCSRALNVVWLPSTVGNCQPRPLQRSAGWRLKGASRMGHPPMGCAGLVSALTAARSASWLGERKPRRSDRARLVLGGKDEVATVRCIFKL